MDRLDLLARWQLLVAAIVLLSKDKVEIQEVAATLLEGWGIILDTVWQAQLRDANVMTGLNLWSFVSRFQALRALPGGCIQPKMLKNVSVHLIGSE